MHLNATFLNTETKTNKRHYLFFSLSFVLFGAIVAFLTSLINYQLQYTDLNKNIQERSLKESLAKSNALNLSIKNYWIHSKLVGHIKIHFA